jgi:hypothetical protein
MRFHSSSLVAPTLLLGLAGAASAHTIAVDGVANEWLPRQPNAADLGMIARDATGRGEFIWRDASGDARTEVAGMPDPAADLLEFRVTADASAMYFLARLPQIVVATPAQLQIALDTAATGGLQTFLSGTETALPVGMGAEFIVRTLFLNAAVTDAGARVYNASQTAVGDVPAVKGADGIEIAVPWQTLGLAGPPSDRVRLCVAVFRAQTATTTVEITGPDALDVLTNYGNPRGPAAPSPGTASEFASDSRVDYFADVYFKASGEIYAPVVISRFVSNGSAGQAGNWVVLRNVSPVDRTSTSLKVGDSETPDDGEGMAALGPGANMPPGGEIVVATSGTAYSAFFGKPPHFETSGDLASVPDALPYGAWSNVAMSPAALGDEYVVLDSSDTILDMAIWGSGSYPGINPLTPAPGAFIVASRNALFADTDDCDVDFTPNGVECASNTGCNTCYTCAQDACVPAGLGTLCNDDTLCNGVETCNGAGQCSSGTAPNCDDGNPCTTDACSHATGCVHGSASAGTPCSDADACTTADACNGSGSCVGTPLDCSEVPPPNCLNSSTSRKYEGGMCTAGGCLFQAVDTACQSGCDAASGLCEEDPCWGLDCSEPPGQCWVFSGTCQDKTCIFEPKPEKAGCDDADACTALDRCDGAGNCEGVPVQCNSSPEPSCVNAGTSRVYSVTGTCNLGSCVYGFSDTTCAATCNQKTGLCDDDPCAEVTCASPPGQCYFALGTCSGGDCHYEPQAPGALCDDGDPCTTSDACDGRGQCAGRGSGGTGRGGSDGAGAGGSGGSGSGGMAGRGGSDAGGAAGSGGAGAGDSAGGAGSGQGGEMGEAGQTGDAGSAGGAGAVSAGAGGTSPNSGGTSSGGTPSMAGSSGSSQSGGTGEAGTGEGPNPAGSGDDGGCGCSVPGSDGNPERSPLAALLLAFAVACRRLRRSSRMR